MGRHGTLPNVRCFDVAIADRDEAVRAIRTVQQLGPDVVVQATARLDRVFVREFPIASGEIRRR